MGLTNCTLSKPQVLIESIESKTEKNEPIFNKISFVEGKNKDTWLMKQSHKGVHAKTADWEELKIEVDKTKMPHVARFYQLKNNKEIEYRVACYLCHANGPRAIRANLNSKNIEYDLKDLYTINYWNLKIKMYGKVKTAEETSLESKKRKTPLKFEGAYMNEMLNVKTCNYCHGTESFWGRAPLKRQHFMAIKHLVKTKAMPPWPFQLSAEEEKEINDFLKL